MLWETEDVGGCGVALGEVEADGSELAICLEKAVEFHEHGFTLVDCCIHDMP
jgi:hypothetical protein